MEFFRKQRPAPGRRTRRALPCCVGCCRLATRVHDGAELIESIRCGKPRCGKLPQGLLYLRPGKVENALNVIGKARSTLLEQGPHLQCLSAERLAETALLDLFPGKRVR